MREECVLWNFLWGASGITPACAGRIGLTLLYGGDDRDHPRMCGKNRFRTGDVTDVWGSPPRMREESSHRRPKRGRRRITPAHAGRIVLQPRFYFSPQDHPRACGKNAGHEWALDNGYRITPAHAGRIPFIRTSGIFGWDHPRACGKN